MTIKRVDLKQYLTKAAKLREQGKSLDADALMERVRGRAQERIRSGEHLHFYVDDAEECVNPARKCWEGLKNVRRT